MTEQKNDATDLLDSLFRRRDVERERMKKSWKVVKGEALPAETNRMGIYRWYLHPAMQTCATRTMLFWSQEIPPGSHSGKQKHQGGRVHYIWEGRGYTIVDGVKHEWEEGDLVMLPLKPDGVVFQHFNTDPRNRALILAAEPNWYDIHGVDMGSGFEQLENAPEYKDR
ncbi:MAG: cupin domain-containing protein [Chloroflexi bacterium]|nr:cupin domain-containing protein [Chloroflexota bacterium]